MSAGRYGHAFEVEACPDQCSGLGKAAFAHQGLGVDVAAAEVAEGDVRRHGIADALNEVVIALGDRLVVRATGCGEGLEGVRSQRIGPDVDVVAGRIAVAREDMTELGRWRMTISFGMPISAIVFFSNSPASMLASGVAARWIFMS